MKLKLMINCSEAVHFCDKAQYSEASKCERILMQMHQRICKLCREHSLLNGKLTQVINDAKLKTLSSKEKESMKNKLSQKGNT